MSIPNVDEFERYLAACTPEERAEAEAVVLWVENCGKAAGMPAFGRQSAIDLAMAMMAWLAAVEIRKAPRK